MSYSLCIYGHGICTGCMECYDQEEGDGDEGKFICADCGEEIDPKEIYAVEEDKLCLSCLCDRFKMCVCEL